MAIYHCCVKIISRSTGRSSVAAAAYRSGEKLYNQREGIEHDFSRKRGVQYSEIMLPENAPAEYQSRETLWNAVELAERRKDAQTAREIEVALPVEFDRQEQIGVLREYVGQNFTSLGMCADICLHDKGDGNPHAHIMLTMRDVTSKGFGGKCREWNDKRNVEDWRQEWAAVCNQQFENKNLPDRLDHRSFERQGKVQLPTIHLGVSAAAMEKRGEKTERGQYNETVKATNKEYQDAMKELKELQQQKDIPKETAEQIIQCIINLKDEFIRLEVQIEQTQRQAGNLRSVDQQLQSRAESIQETIETIEQYSQRIEQLLSEREQLGLFKGRKKKSLDGQINRLKASMIQAEANLQKECGADGQVATLQQLRQQQVKIQAQLSSLPDINKLKEQQSAIEQQYRQAIEVAMQRSDWTLIQEQFEKIKKGAGKEKMAIARAESRLKDMGRSKLYMKREQEK